MFEIPFNNYSCNLKLSIIDSYAIRFSNLGKLSNFVLGLVVGDEILVINGQAVAQLDMVFIENLLHEVQVVCLMVRSCRIDRPHNVSATPAIADQADLHCGDAQVTSPASALSLHPLGAERLPLDTVAMAANSSE